MSVDSRPVPVDSSATSSVLPIPSVGSASTKLAVICDQDRTSAVVEAMESAVCADGGVRAAGEPVTSRYFVAEMVVAVAPVQMYDPALFAWTDARTDVAEMKTVSPGWVKALKATERVMVTALPDTMASASVPDAAEMIARSTPPAMSTPGTASSWAAKAVGVASAAIVMAVAAPPFTRTLMFVEAMGGKNVNAPVLGTTSSVLASTWNEIRLPSLP